MDNILLRISKKDSEEAAALLLFITLTSQNQGFRSLEHSINNQPVCDIIGEISEHTCLSTESGKQGMQL